MHSTTSSIFLSTAIELVDLGLCPVILGGKKPIFGSWPEYMPGWASPADVGMKPGAVPPYSRALLESWSRDYPNANIGVNCRERPTIDIDDPEILPFIWDLLPRTPHRKRGRRGYGLIYRQDPVDPVTRSRSFPSVADGHMLIEILSDGRQTVLPPSIHPDTGMPYEWEPTPWGDPATPLNACPPPTLSQTQVDAIETRLRDHGLIGVKRERGADLGRSVEAAERPRYEAFLQPKIVERLEALRTAERGGRQDALNGAVVALAPWVREGFLTEEWLEGATHAACEENGYIRDDGEKAFSTQFGKSMAYGWENGKLPDLDGGAEARMGPAPELPSWLTGAPGADAGWASGGGYNYTMPPPIGGDEPLPPLKGFDTFQAMQEEIPPRLWTVAGWIPHKQVSLLYGDGSSGKTTLLMQLAMAAARGGNWLGMAVEKRKVLFISGEDEERELRYRANEIRRLYEVPDAGQLCFLSLVSEPGVEDTFITETGRDEKTKAGPMFARILELVDREGFDMVILDPVAALFDGTQNSAKSVYSFIALLRRHLAFDRGCTVVIAAHPSTDGMRTGTGTSGSVAWNNACRSRMYFTKAEGDDPELMKLGLVKANRGRAGDEVLVKWVEGVFITTTAQAPREAAQSALTGPACMLFMDLLRRAIDHGESVPPRETAGRFAEMREARDAGIRKKALTQAQKDLLDAGRISIQMVERSRQLVITPGF